MKWLKIGMPLNSPELEIVNLLADAYNKFCELPKQHPQDGAEFTDAIHRLQHLVMKRSTVRDHPDIFTNEKQDGN